MKEKVKQEEQVKQEEELYWTMLNQLKELAKKAKNWENLKKI